MCYNDDGDDMKKYILLVLAFIFLIVSFILSWYSDELLYFLFIFKVLLDILFLILLSIFLIIILKITISKGKKLVNYLTTIVLLISAIIFILPMRFIKAKVEFKLYKNERNEVINMVRNGKIKVDEYGNAKLPDKYRKISTSGEIFIYQNDEEGCVVGFWIFRGLQSGSVELIYSLNGKKNIYENETGHDLTRIEEWDKNWYYVNTDY